MPNVNAPSGLSPVMYKNGSPWNGQARVYYIASTDVNAFAIGDPVALTGTGDAKGVPGVTLATAGSANPVLGAVVGVGGTVYGGPMADPTNLNTTVVPATKLRAYYVMVADDPNIVFEIQESITSATPLTTAAVTKNANLLSGTNSGYMSGWQFNNNTTGTGATLQLHLFGLVQRPDNAFGAYAKWLCTINTHALANNIAGV
jgi:hypothetical protein